MEVTIEQSCPSCGGPITIKEDDRLIRCEFCGVYNYKTDNGAERFVLPARCARGIDGSDLIYAPYLRFKGSIFYVRDNEVQYKIVDTTHLGLDNQLLPVSLGLRPQAMQIRPVVSALGGSFLQQTLATRTVFAHAVKIVDLFDPHSAKTCHHRAFIGETVSCIYQPCYIKKNNLHDAVTDGIIGDYSLLGDSLHQSSASRTDWEPRFITTLCPQCGGLLAGESDALILQCRNCRSLWQEQNGAFAPRDCTVVAAKAQDARYLPFWRIYFTTAGDVLRYFADFLRFTNQPLVPLPKYEERPLCFLIPAFKIKPRAFLQLASQLTVAQTRLPPGEARRVSNDYPVTLDQNEGLQAIKSVLAYSTVNREKRFPMLPDLQLTAERCELTYLPFAATTHDLVQEHTLATVQRAVMRYGRAL